MIEIILFLGFLLAPAVLYGIFERLPSPRLSALMPVILALALSVIVPRYYQFQVAGPEALAGTLTIVAVQVLGILTPLPLVAERFGNWRKYLLITAVSASSFLFIFLLGFAGDFNVSPVSEAALQAGTIVPFFFSSRLILTFLLFLIMSASICGFILLIFLIREDYPDVMSTIGWVSAAVVLAPLLYVADCFFIAALAAVWCHLTASVRHPWFSLAFPILLVLPVSFLLTRSEILIDLYDTPLLVLLLSSVIISLGMAAAFEALGSLRLSRFNRTINILLGAASVAMIDLILKYTGYPDLFIVIPDHPLAGFVLVGIIVASVLVLGGRVVPGCDRRA
ncbi:hypothetical protein [Methanofollis ethanolicus]|uniref:hypothetical protein n=1 Tax=Methanofollis ethanolicus TaxID=488124 RepID=UPI00082D756E|nr:hypothetical protein [Methanofollis ethanolicus]